MENVTINRLAGIYEKLAAVEDRYLVGELNEDILYALTQIIQMINEDPPNINEILETINYVGVKNDPNYKFLLLDKLDSLIRKTMDELSSSVPPRFAYMPEIYKTFSNEKLDTLLSTDFEQLKRKLLNISAQEKTLKEDDDAGRTRLNEYREYIKDLMLDKGKAHFYKDEIKFLIKMNSAMNGIKNFINDILLKANNAVETAKKKKESPVTTPEPAVKTKKRSPSAQKVLEEEVDDIPESVEKIGPQVRHKKDEEGNIVIVPEETESDRQRVIRAIEIVQENIGEGLRINFEIDNYRNIKNKLFENLVNIGILTYDPTTDSDKTRKETLVEFTLLLKKYRDLAKRYLNEALALIDSRGKIVKRVKTDDGKGSQIQAPSELLKLGAMLETHVADVGKFIAELEKLYFTLTTEQKRRAV